MRVNKYCALNRCCHDHVVYTLHVTYRVPQLNCVTHRQHKDQGGQHCCQCLPKVCSQCQRKLSFWIWEQFSMSHGLGNGSCRGLDERIPEERGTQRGRGGTGGRSETSCFSRSFLTRSSQGRQQEQHKSASNIYIYVFFSFQKHFSL